MYSKMIRYALTYTAVRDNDILICPSDHQIQVVIVAVSRPSNILTQIKRVRVSQEALRVLVAR